MIGEELRELINAEYGMELRVLLNAEFGMDEKGFIVDLDRYEKYIKLRIKNEIIKEITNERNN